MTRGTSTNVLARSNYYSGPCEEAQIQMFSVPYEEETSYPINVCAMLTAEVCEDIIPYEKYSSFRKLCRVMHHVRKYIFKLKQKVRERKPELFLQLSATNYSYGTTVAFVFRMAQKADYPDVLSSFQTTSKLPNPLVSQLNLTIDNGILRVKGKCAKLKKGQKFPILLHKNGKLTSLLIKDYHATLGHPGVYKVLSLIREQFWIPSGYMTVKKIIKKCLTCKKLFGRPIRINQNDYKDFRINPSDFPFRDIAIDYITFNIRDDENQRTKINVLIVTCLFTRAINLIACDRGDTECFLEALQSQIYEYGMPQFILSDNGSQIVGCVKCIQSFLDEVEVQNFLAERNIKKLEFSPYPAGASYLGGVVESLVKQVKNMLYASVGKNLLTRSKFCLFLRECKMLVNKRPIAMKNSVANDDADLNISPLTPEMLLYGYEVPAISIIPHLYGEGIEDSFCQNVPYSEKRLYEAFNSLRKVKNNLTELYSKEFLTNLRYQSINSQNRYTEKTHHRLAIGDLVSVKTKFTKPYDFPYGLVTETEENDIGEIVHVSIRKANGEVIRRHVTDVIFLQSNPTQGDCGPKLHAQVQEHSRGGVRRKAAEECASRISLLRESGVI